MSLGRRMLVASVVLAALVAGAFAALIFAVSTLRDANERETRSKDVTEATLQLEKLVVDLETGLRGFTLTGNRRVLQPYTAARAELPERLRVFVGRASSEPDQRRRANGISQLIGQYVRDYTVPVIDLARESPVAARSSPVTIEGKRQTDEIRARFDRFLTAERQLAREAASTAGSRSNRALAVGAFGVAASTMLIVLFGVLLGRAIGRPVRAVASGASRLAGGELSHRLSTEGPGEIGELTRSFNSMAEKVQSGREELELQNAKLRESESLKTELIAIVSHELRTPLASVLGFTSLLLQRDFDHQARRHYLGIVDAQARRLAALLEDFLDVQRIEDGRLELAQEAVDMAALLDEQAQLYRAQSPKHQLLLNLPRGPLPVRGDSNRLAQVVGNLLSNAIKYSPEGGVVELAGETEEGAVRVRVRDEGLGIASDQQSRIFTKFFRGEAGASGIGGTGLGLAVSREIVEAHGGRIGFSSKAGAGSTFWLELPVAGVTAAGSGKEGRNGSERKETQK
ncbi:MAG: CHASE3 domain-containing protein [Actinobacteria bacterium]|nr:CHASE3 domain-containing protein [Actinomycetota bacterium]